MTTPKRPKTSAVSPDQLVELYGPDNDGWYDTRVMDWIALCERLKDGEVRGYLVLRSLVVDKFKNHVRKLTLQLLCELIPSPSGGPSSLTRVRGILDGLTKVGLVTTPEGKPIKTSSRVSALTKPLRIRINDRAPADYAGWRNSEDKLKALGTALADLVEEGAQETSAAADQRVLEAGRKSDPAWASGRKSDPAGRKSDPRSRISDPHPGSDQRERDLPLGSSSGFSLSLKAGASASAESEHRVDERETAAPEDNPASAGESLPAPREGEDDSERYSELLALLLRLPGGDRMSRDEVTTTLLPLAVGAVAEGWTPAQLSKHLARGCDPERAYSPAAIYRSHLSKLPPAPAGKASGLAGTPEGERRRNVLPIDDPHHKPVKRDMSAIRDLIASMSQPSI